VELHALVNGRTWFIAVDSASRLALGNRKVYGI
jgi:hypothetical protein